MVTPQNLIKQAYAAFNARDISTVLATLHPQVRWSKAWEGDYATGHNEVREYWQRQWQELDPHVEPTSIRERADGRLEVAVQQLVKDKQGKVLFEGLVKHLYTLRDGLLQQMDIEQV
ncbi:nuclear transport factor 2 family protein [Hymenobacter wooponensis]|uniref:Nuclear transport factor 2 family protein n=1 Tax=Hymenobacter wooponensis TaxID=1525360 RepID=A0A4Z0MTV3_9BACT|nr:nuclear transport factor 2 family protein [Hymenobacter wooponensis]TGD82677.1 nuclear transport factor 2 family protein [Hymenobacter wooponensis]